MAAGDGRKVVVIGGGIAGSYIAKSLQFHGTVTLIDQKEYLEIPWACLRGMVEPTFGGRSLIQHKHYLRTSSHIVSNVINIFESEVLTSDENEKLRSAESILIVGGGPTGVELAGEIAVDFPEKNITLVHKGYRLLEFLGPKASKKTLDWLKSKHVEVKLAQTVSLDDVADGRKLYKTSSGETIEADCHFLCIGKPSASLWLKNTFLRDRLDDNGRLIVDENLRVKGSKNIFAIGDITNIKEMKQGYLAKKQASVVTKSLKWLLGGGSESEISTYKVSSVNRAIVSLGRHDSVTQLPLNAMIGRIPGLIKSFIYKYDSLRCLLQDPRHS